MARLPSIARDAVHRVPHATVKLQDSAASGGRTAVSSNGKDYASYSFWLENSGDDLTPRPPLDGSTEVDVAIMGAGFSGLWTAYHLLRRDPSLNVMVVEQEIAGFGASGRN